MMVSVDEGKSSTQLIFHRRVLAAFPASAIRHHRKLLPRYAKTRIIWIKVKGAKGLGYDRRR